MSNVIEINFAEHIDEATLILTWMSARNIPLNEIHALETLPDQLAEGLLELMSADGRRQIDECRASARRARYLHNVTTKRTQPWTPRT